MYRNSRSSVKEKRILEYSYHSVRGLELMLPSSAEPCGRVSSGNWCSGAHLVAGIALFIIGLLSSAQVLVGAIRDLKTNHVEYLGYFFVPSKPGFLFMEGGLSLAQDCLGREDPSPEDGFNGCIVISGKFQPAPDPVIIGAFDIVPPSAIGANEANVVVPMYDVTAGYPNDRFPEIHDGKRDRVFEVYVVEEDGECKAIHWWFIGFYGDKPVGAPLYGISDCNTTNPKVLGMWPVFENPSPPKNMGADPYHPHKWDRGIIKIPSSIANKYFDGYTQGFASGKQSGTSGTSAGPSLAIRTAPAFSVPSCEISLRPLLYYYTGTRMKYQGYPIWYKKEQFRTTDGYQFTNVHRGNGGEIVVDGSYAAYVQPLRRPYFCPDCYPANDPNAGPTHCRNCVVQDDPPIYTQRDRVYSEKYRDHPKKYPNPDRDVITWYGIQSCGDGKKAKYRQFVSWFDWLRDGSTAPMDCDLYDKNVSRICNAGTGPNGVNYHTELVFYSVNDLGRAYQGEIEPYEILPYAELEITPDLSNDGYNVEDYCIGEPVGTTYDEINNLLYVGYGGGKPFIQVFRISSGSS